MFSPRLLLAVGVMGLLPGAALAQSLPGTPEPDRVLRDTPRPSDAARPPVRDPSMAAAPSRRLDAERRRVDPMASPPMRGAPARTPGTGRMGRPF